MQLGKKNPMKIQPLFYFLGDFRRRRTADDGTGKMYDIARVTRKLQKSIRNTTNYLFSADAIDRKNRL